MSYFVFEGVDGVGKTTTMQNVARRLIEAGHNVVLTKEPGGPLALELEWEFPLWAYNHYGHRYQGFRRMCVDHPEIPQLVKRALYKADSFYNWEVVVKPGLDAGAIVLSDRSWVSDLAYGMALTGRSLRQLFDFNMALIPEQFDVTNVIYLYLPEAVRESRLATNVTNEMDKLGPAKRNEIESAYQRVFMTCSDLRHVYEVSTEAPPDDVAEEIVELILA